MTKEEKLADIEEYRTMNLPASRIPPYIYEWAEELGLINFTDSEKVAMYSESIKIREEQIRADGDRVEWKRFKHMKENHFQNINPAETSAINLIFKRLAIKKYYDTINGNQ
jgi:hypothetical protein